jgi:hypothetical protein
MRIVKHCNRTVNGVATCTWTPLSPSYVMGTRMLTCGSGTISTTNSSEHSLAERGCIIQRASYSVQRKVHVPSNKESGVVHQAPTRKTQHAEVIVRCATCSMQQGPGGPESRRAPVRASDGRAWGGLCCDATMWSLSDSVPFALSRAGVRVPLV